MSNIKASKFTGRGTPLRVDAFDDGGRGSDTQKIEQAVEGTAVALSNHIDRAIRQIADESGDSEFRGAALGIPAKVHTLNQASHDRVDAHKL